MRLSSKLIEVRIAALTEALKYGEAGLELVIQALNNDFCKVRQAAYFILQVRTEPQVKKALEEYGVPKNRYNLFVNIAQQGEKYDIDILMTALQNDRDISTVKLVDYALSLVNNPFGKEQIKHYLFNGTPLQRNYAALYFKRLKNKEILAEAVKLGCIDRVQAFSK